MKKEGKTWLAAILEIQFKLNSSYNASRKSSPFQVVYGFNLRARPPILPYPQLIFTNAKQRHNTTSTNLTQAKINQTIQANKYTPKSKLYTKDEVLLLTKNIRMQTLKTKPEWIGPFKVQTFNHWFNNYTLDFLEHPDLQLLYNNFHILVLKPYYRNDPTKFPNREASKPPPVQDDRYTVSKVLEFRTRPGTGAREYKVRWEGYGPEYDEWVSALDIDSDLLENYWMYGVQQATLSKRPVGNKAWGKKKIREETFRMIREERERVVKSARQLIMISIDGEKRPATDQEVTKLLRTSILSQPLCKLGGMLVRQNRSTRKYSCWGK